MSAEQKPCYECLRMVVEGFFYGPQRDYWNSLDPTYRRHAVHNSMCDNCRSYFVGLMLKNGMLRPNE